MTQISRSFIEQLPKTDLHCHFDGSIRINTVIELAKRHKIPIYSTEPSVLMEHMKYGRVRQSLVEYLAGFEPLVGVLQHADDIERAFYEVCEDAALENVRHLELRYCPYLHTQKGLSQKEVVEACIRAAGKAEQNFNMTVRHILCGLKQEPHTSNFAVAKLASLYCNQGVVGFDLAGPEIGFPIKDHAQALQWAQAHNMFITIHAGENSGPENIFEAIHEAKAQRIGHGTSLLRDNQLLNYVIEHRIGIESCPLSNWHTGSVKSLDAHPIKEFLKRGVLVSINTDNRLCSDTTITKELCAMVEHVGMGLDDIKNLLANGFKSAFLPNETKAKLLRDFDVAWAKLMLHADG